MPDEYDQKIRGVIPYYGEIHAEIINLIRSFNECPKVWLDTGCGTGSLITKAIELFPQTKFVLADPSGSMLDQAKAKFSGSDRVLILPPAKTQELRTVFPEKADVITAVQCHHYQKRDERSAAVKGKGYWGLYQKDYGRCDEEITKHLSRFDKEYFPITIEEHLALLRGAGFRTVEMFWYSYLQAGFYSIK